MIRDSYYTPDKLAEKLISFVGEKAVDSIADFSVGDGQLFRAAEVRWPGATYFGFDISDEAIKESQSHHPHWILRQMDFLEEFNFKDEIISACGKMFDLILLNPPFSCKGSKTYETSIDGRNFLVSTAMKFIVEALPYLKSDGMVLAILPASCAYSVKDSEAWHYLEKQYNLSILEEPKTNYFAGCSPNIILVALNDFTRLSKKHHISKMPRKTDKVRLFRGKVSMHEVNIIPGDHYFVHTTNLQDHRLVNLDVRTDHRFSKTRGPAILIPRVGKPRVSKICIIKADETYILSDCIISIEFDRYSEALSIYLYLLENWESIEKMYKGTGAKYITLSNLRTFFENNVQSVKQNLVFSQMAEFSFIPTVEAIQLLG